MLRGSNRRLGGVARYAKRKSLADDYARRMAARWAAYQRAWSRNRAHYEKLYRESMRKAEEPEKEARKRRSGWKFGLPFRIPIEKIVNPVTKAAEAVKKAAGSFGRKVVRKAREAVSAATHVASRALEEAKEIGEKAKKVAEKGAEKLRKAIGEAGEWADKQFQNVVAKRDFSPAALAGAAAALVLPTALMKKIGGKKASWGNVALDVISLVPVAKAVKALKALRAGRWVGRGAEVAAKAAKEAEEAAKAVKAAKAVEEASKIEKAAKALEEAKKALKATKPLRKAIPAMRARAAHFRAKAWRRKALAAGAAGAAGLALATHARAENPSLADDYARRMAARWAAYQRAWSRNRAHYEKLYRESMRKAEEPEKEARKEARNDEHEKLVRKIMEDTKRRMKTCPLARRVVQRYGLRGWAERVAADIERSKRYMKELEKLLMEAKKRGILDPRLRDLERLLKYAKEGKASVSAVDVAIAREIVEGSGRVYIPEVNLRRPARRVARRPVTAVVVKRRVSKPASRESALRQVSHIEKVLLSEPAAPVLLLGAAGLVLVLLARR